MFLKTALRKKTFFTNVLLLPLEINGVKRSLGLARIKSGYLEF